MGDAKNCIGQKFGKLTIIKELEPVTDNSGSKRRMVEVLCDCGNTTKKKLKYLKSGETISCSDCKEVFAGYSETGNSVFKVDAKKDEMGLVGQKHGRLTITSVGYRMDKSRMINTVCQCGSSLFVNKKALLKGHTTSCGCLNKEIIGSLNKTHGMSTTQTYITWHNMRQRCENPNNNNYNNYGGRGIAVCNSWSDFNNFLADMGERPDNLTLERVDVNGDYSKDNCIWADDTTQSFNRRIHGNNTSGKSGVVWNKRLGKWSASISMNNNRIHLGYYADIDTAITVRLEAELKYYGFNKE